jgi:uncharacterized protein YdbL (DUF1318 family)
MNIFRIFAIAVALAFSGLAIGPAANAGDPQIEAAISAGTVGERIDGYLGVVGSADASIIRKVREINNRRRALYTQLANQKGATVAQVARITGEKQLANARAGAFIMGDTGSWKRK